MVYSGIRTVYLNSYRGSSVQLITEVVLEVVVVAVLWWAKNSIVSGGGVGGC